MVSRVMRWLRRFSEALLKVVFVTAMVYASLFVLMWMRLIEKATIKDFLDVGIWIGILLVTYWYADSTKQVAKATIALAKEAHEQSLASFRPVVWFGIHQPEVVSTPRQSDSLDVHNIGRGPAIQVHWELVQEDARHNRVVSLETFRELGPDQKMEDAVGTPQWATNGTRVRLSCIYQDIQKNGFMVSVPIEFRTPPGHALTFFGLEHIQWQEVPYDQWQTLHECFHQS